VKRSFDNLAKAYIYLERLTFGHQLERSRHHGLKALKPNKGQRCLILGPGDGRFSSLALARNPKFQIDSIERSPKMQKQTNARIRTLGESCINRYRHIANDVRQYSFPDSEYDIVVAQYFLDCFKSIDANRLLEKFALTLKPGGKLVYADFTIPQEIPAKWIATGIVKLLYLCFRLATDIQTNRLPELIWPESLKLISSETRLRGLVTSTIRKKDPD
jgi:ubiquinone/menaquinone biosynthesis C-methylase UbiE